jgi:hypothetical protein
MRASAPASRRAPPTPHPSFEIIIKSQTHPRDCQTDTYNAIWIFFSPALCTLKLLYIAAVRRHFPAPE